MGDSMEAQPVDPTKLSLLWLRSPRLPERKGGGGRRAAQGRQGKDQDFCSACWLPPGHQGLLGGDLGLKAGITPAGSHSHIHMCVHSACR